MANRYHKVLTVHEAEEFLDSYPGVDMSTQQTIDNLEDILNSLSYQQLMSIGYSEEYLKNLIINESKKIQHGLQVSIPYAGYFDGYEIKVIKGATGRLGRFEFYYGGIDKPDGDGHGHVVCNDGINIIYWKKPKCEGGGIVIDELKGLMF